MLHARKSVLGASLMKPSMMVLALKLCTRHTRANDRLARIIKINEENARFNNSHN